ncbi:MAG: saccharopine dehydrogenase NADP-binding domain-containing protein, partial [Gemmatimonadales bacterium]
MKHVLVLGAGLVVKPLLDDLLTEPDIRVRLATLNIDRARQLLTGKPRGEALVFNALDESQLLPEVERADAVVSLLPADQHVHIAEACLRYRTPLVTTSYISAGMQALDAQA